MSRLNYDGQEADKTLKRSAHHVPLRQTIQTNKKGMYDGRKGSSLFAAGLKKRRKPRVKIVTLNDGKGRFFLFLQHNPRLCSGRSETQKRQNQMMRCK